MFRIVRADEGEVRKIAQNKTATNLITKDITPDVSLATTEAANYYEKEITEYNRIYFVIEGKLELGFKGEFTELAAGDACYIGKGTQYEMQGTFKALVVNQPAFGS